MMIEKTIIDYLASVLTEPVYAEVPPQPTPTKYVVVEKTAGGKENHICSANIAVQSCATTLYDAALLNETVKTAMEGILELGSIGGCHLDTDYNFTDTSTKTYRYQAIFRITYYGG